MRVDRTVLTTSLKVAGIHHPFMEDCPCGGCEDFFGFGRGAGPSLWIAFSTDERAPTCLWREGEPPLSLARVSRELLEVLRKVRDVLDMSDPAAPDVPFAHLPEVRPIPPQIGLAARVLSRVGLPVERKRGTEPRRITFRGEELTIAEWSERTGVASKSIYWRLSQGWETEEALTRPVQHRRSG